MIIEDGGPAFPSESTLEFMPDGAIRNRGEYEPAQTGMTLRDYFAAAALTSIIPREGWILAKLKEEADFAAADAYCIADAMLAARKGGNV